MLKGMGYAARNSEGFTLIEVLIALVIMSFGAILLFYIYVPSAKWAHKAGEDTQAIGYAVAIIEDLRAHNENLYQIAATNPNDENLHLNHSYQPEGFTAEINIIPFYDEQVANLYTVTVNVKAIPDKTGRKITLTTVIRGNGELTIVEQ